MLRISLGEVTWGFHLGFTAEGCHSFDSMQQPQKQIVKQDFFFCFIFVLILLGISLVSKPCSTAEMAQRNISVCKTLAPDLMLAFSLLTSYGSNQTDPEKRGCVVYNSRFQLGLNRWKQEMRNSDKHYMPCILCNKFIWLLSCCVYLQNMSTANFRGMVYFIWHLHSLWFVPCGCRQIIYFYRAQFAFMYFFAAIKCFNFFSPKNVYLVLVLFCLTGIFAASVSVPFIGKKWGSLGLRQKGCQSKLLQAVLRLVPAVAVRHGCCDRCCGVSRGCSTSLVWFPRL